jgi:transcriptional regulator with XRE-family HTH domain
MDSRHYRATKLIEARQLRGKTQQQIATALNVDRQTIYRAESGKATSYELLARLGAYYQLPMTTIVVDFPPIEPSSASM